MYRIDNTSAASTKPSYGSAGTEAFFQDTDPSGGTVVPAWWANQIQEELRAVVVAGGLTPTKSNDAQVLAAINALIAAAITAAAASLTPQQYQVGDLFYTTRSGNPSSLLGYGTWALYGAGRVGVCVDTTDPDFATVGLTGGRKFIPCDGWNNSDGTVSQKSNQYLWGERGSTDGPASPDPAAGNLEAGRLIIASGKKEEEEGLESLAYAGARAGASNTPRDSNVSNLQPFITEYHWLRTA